MPSPSALRWLSLVGVIWLQSINGTNTDFPAYSSQFKRLLSISQVQLNNLAFASDAGKLLGWLSGLAAAYLPLWLVLLIGATLGLVGYGVQFLFLVTGAMPVPYWKVFLLCVVAGNSICWINTVCYLITIRNFPSDHQIAVGLSTSYVGLSAKIYTAIVDAAFGRGAGPSRSSRAYLLLNSVVPLGVSAATAPLMREVADGGSARLACGFVVLLMVALVTGIYAILSTVGPLSKLATPAVRAIALVVLLAAPLVIPAARMIADVGRGNFPIQREMKVHSFGADGAEEDKEERVAAEVKEEGVVEEAVVRTAEEVGVKKMVRRVDFWLYFFVYMFGATLGMVFLNNLGQIAESRGLASASTLVSLSSSFGFFGRLAPSLVDYFFPKHSLSRIGSATTMMVPMSIAFFMLLHNNHFSLYINTAIIGVCSSAITTIAVSITSELFGMKNFGVNHNVIIANIPIGSLSFGYLAGYVYQRGVDTNGKCMGAHCYANTFIAWGSICSFGTVLSFILYLRARKREG